MALSRRRRLAIFARDKYTCLHCGFTTTRERVIELLDEARENDGRQPLGELLTVDHIWPVSKGGSNRQTNLQTLCSLCNTAKGNALPDAPGGRTVEPSRLLRGRPAPGLSTVASRLHLPGCDPMFGCVSHCPVRGSGYPAGGDWL